MSSAAAAGVPAISAVPHTHTVLDRYQCTECPWWRDLKKGRVRADRVHGYLTGCVNSGHRALTTGGQAPRRRTSPPMGRKYRHFSGETENRRSRSRR